jgi:ATP-binding cassette subfamily B protein/subfamily B ATP-binding cassette protein MsbA
MSTVSRALRYLRPYARLAFVSGGITVAAAGTALLAPWPLKFLIDNVLQDQPMPESLGGIIGGVDNRYTLLALAAAAGLLITLAQNGLSVLENYVNTTLDQRMVLDFRSDLFRHTQRLSLTFHDKRRTGDFMSRINSQAAAVGSIPLTAPPIVQAILTLAGTFWIVLKIDWVLALISLSVVPFLYYSTAYYAERIEPRLLKVKGMEGQALTIIHETMSMLRVILAFGREDFEHRRFRDHGESAVDARVKLTVRQTMFSLAVNGITALGTALVLLVGSLHVLGGTLTTGELLVVMAYIASVYSPLEVISTMAGALKEKLISLRLAFELLDTEPEVLDMPGALPLAGAAGRIEFRDVRFSYRGRKDTLKDIAFEARPGELIAIVGPTGAGKSTLVSLIPRFYDPSQGQVMLDGHDLRTITLESLREQVSLVLQEPMLFSGSIADNIRYGRLDARMGEIMDAARAANAHDFIQALPSKYDSTLGERGAMLSGGERQRICIARAFLKNAPILVLDEPTSAIDSRTESVILDALDRLVAGRTTFMVAHRLSTVRNADLILVMDGGRIVERGRHDELATGNGLYAQLWAAQSAIRRSRPHAPAHGAPEAIEMPA